MARGANHVNRDSFITEMPGISQAGVVALHKLGINRIADLLEADYERVAVVLDDFNEATRLLREARRLIAADEPASAPTPAPLPMRKVVAASPPPHTPAPQPPPAPVMPAAPAPNRKLGTRHRAPLRPQSAAPRPPEAAPPAPPSAAPVPRPAPAHIARPVAPSGPRPSAPTASAQIPQPPGPLSSQPEPRAYAPAAPAARTTRPDEQAVSNALSQAARGLQFTADATADRLTLARRLQAAATLLGQGAAHDDVVAALILESVEQGTVPAASVARTFGERAAALVDECGTLRAVPVSPLGKLPKYYLEMAGRSSLSSRRICAVHQLAHLSFSDTTAEADGDSRGALWYSRMLLQALEAGGSDPVILSLRAALDSAERIAA